MPCLLTNRCKMEVQQGEIRDKVVELLKDGSVDAIIGYETGTLPLRSSPCVIRSAEHADRLVWNMSCGSNLATYLPAFAKANPEIKVGILAKGCDSRSIVGLLKERQIERERIFVVGVTCSGMVDRRKIDDDLDGMEIIEAQFDSDGLVIK